MRSICKAIVATAFLATAIPTMAADNGWVTLLDGAEGMDNFTIVGDANWAPRMNSIMATEGSGASFLLSRETYKDFMLRVEFWASPDANSGIYMRCSEPGRITDRNCYEANVFDQRPDPSFGTGAIVHIAPVEEPRPQAGDRWNVFLITVQGDHLKVELNGETTADVHDTTLTEAGPFGLQWGRGTLRFRKVEILPL